VPIIPPIRYTADLPLSVEVSGLRITEEFPMNHSKSIVAFLTFVVLCSALAASAQTSGNRMDDISYWQARATGQAVPASPTMIMPNEVPAVFPASYQEQGADSSLSPSDLSAPLSLIPATPDTMGGIAHPQLQGGPMLDPGYSMPIQGKPVRPRLLVSGEIEYINWWLSGMKVPALVTTSPATVPRADAGVLGHADTTVLFGDEPLNDDGQAGIRFSLGFSLNPCGPRTLMVDYFSTGRAHESFSGSDADYSVLARPYYDVTIPGESVETVVYPGYASGSISVEATTEFQGLELLVKRSLFEDCRTSADLIWGYRWMSLDDQLTISHSRELLQQGVAGQRFDLMDDFLTENNFHGGEVGLKVKRILSPRWSLDVLGKLAIGGVHSEVVIDGSGVFTDPGGGTFDVNGLLAQPSNIGTYEKNSLATGTELGFTLRRAFRPHLDVTIGYTFLYWSNVARAGEQIDRNVDTNQPPAPGGPDPKFPEFNFISSDFLAQGLSVGLEYEY
jgi:hypothetical protein